ncbi:hypothetical protein V8G54_012073 [Vigna mungo]|uniref:Uncharacterized protein n=1 Tax=Vigna mungo TaxID=3915 RepID=A0AAQ3S1W7_VIGMU
MSLGDDKEGVFPTKQSFYWSILVVQMQLQRLLQQSLGVSNVDLSGVRQHEVAVLEEGERGGFPVQRLNDSDAESFNWHRSISGFIAGAGEMIESEVRGVVVVVCIMLGALKWCVYPYTQSIVHTQIEKNSVSGESRGRSSSIVLEFRHRQIGGFTLHSVGGFTLHSVGGVPAELCKCKDDQ